MNFHTHIKGDKTKPAVILIHGLLGASRNLNRLQDAIATDGFFTLSYDQRGHGHSDHASADTYSLTQLSDDLIEILNRNGIEKAHLVGHSMGGRVSLVTAARYPSRVLSLSMLDVGPRIDTHALETLHSIIDPLPESFADRAEASAFLAQSLHLPTRMKALYEQFLLANLRSVDGRMKWIFDLEGIRQGLLNAINNDNTDQFVKIKCPILAARGELSDHFTINELNEMKSLNKNVQIASIANAGHWVHAENFQGTFDVIQQFLKDKK